MLKLLKTVYSHTLTRLVFLILVLLAVFSYGSGRFIFVRAYNNQVNVFPGAYELEQTEHVLSWQQIENISFQDLSNQAEISEFNSSNSAVILLPESDSVDREIEADNEEAVEDIEAPASALEDEEEQDNNQEEENADGEQPEAREETNTQDEFINTAQDKEATKPESEGEEVNNSDTNTTENEPASDIEISAETVEPGGIEAEDISNIDAGGETPLIKTLYAKAVNHLASLDLFNFKLAKAQNDETGIRELKQSLIVSDFNVPIESIENGLGEVSLRLSFAAMSPFLDDEIWIEYSLNGGWQDLGKFYLINEVSNANREDYFVFKVPNIESREEINKLKFRISYFSQTAYASGSLEEAETPLAIYLDALWLEIDYNEPVEENSVIEPNDAEGPYESEEATRDEALTVAPAAEIIKNPTGENFKSSEKPKFSYNYERIRANWFSKLGANFLNIFRDEYKNIEIKAALKDPSGRASENLAVKAAYLKDGEFSIEIYKNEREFRPGKYRLAVAVIDGEKITNYTQDFTWGVLALNVNKSIYLFGETAFLQMGVLDDEGHTLCNARVYLEITAPDGGMAELNTDNALIEINPECAGDTKIKGPDYFSYYEVGPLGTYQVKLTAITKNGVREIIDSFEVRDMVPYEIERIGPTRIFPMEAYDMKFRIKANINYIGEVSEFLPADFIVADNRGGRIEALGDAKKLSWAVNLKHGETIELGYTFDAPDKAPEFYLLGPLEMSGNGESGFWEIRQWQIAADAVSEYDYNAGSDVNSAWTLAGTLPAYAWDSNNNSYAGRDIPKKTGSGEPANHLDATANNTPGNSYSISKVEIGIEGYVENTGDITVYLLPEFDGSDGTATTVPGIDLGTSDSGTTFYKNITNVGGAPSPWTWTDVQNLDVEVYGGNSNNGQARWIRIDQIRVKVTYAIPNDAPIVSFNATSTKRDGSGMVDIEIELDDNDDNDVEARVEYESGGSCVFSSALKATLDETDGNTTADFGDPNVENDNFYQIGNATEYIKTASGSNSVHFDWDSRADAPAGDGAYCLRIWANDTVATSTAATSTIVIDNAAPTGLGSLIETATSGTWVKLSFGSAATESNFREYKIFYKEYDGSLPDAGDDVWASSSDSNLGAQNYGTAASTTITNLFPSTQYIFNIWAYDQYGNIASATPVLATTSAQQVPPILSINSIAQKADATGDVAVSIEVDDGNDDEVRVRMDYAGGTACNFGVPLDPILDPAGIGADWGTPAIDNNYAYQIGTTSNMIITISGSNTVTFDWLSRSHNPDLEGDYCVQFTANDLVSGDDLTPATTTLTIDNTKPTAPGQLTADSATDRSVTLILGATTTEAHFLDYKIWLATTSPVTNGSWEHDDANFNNINYNGATTTTITNLSPETTYYINIWAYDTAGYSASSTEISVATGEAVPIRARTVTFLAGTYSGDGTTGQNSDADQTFDGFNFKLAEDGVEIKNAYIIFEAQFEAYANNAGNYTGYELAFDSCEENCSADAFAGSGRVKKDDNTVLAYDETESNQVRLLLDVIEEAQLAAYAGGGFELEGQVGYRIERGILANSISYATARLVITYTYNENQSENFTNTVWYPLNSTNGTDSGSRQAIQANTCTPNTNCPLFNYQIDIPEIGIRLDHWFETNLINYDNNQNRADDIAVDVNIQSEDVSTYTFYHENVNKGSQGNTPTMYFTSALDGFSENTAQTLEIHAVSGNYDYYLMGGEAAATYIASSSAGIKTRTVSFPIGILSNGASVAQASGSVSVYFPENGKATGTVAIKDAWLRIQSSNYTEGAAAVNLTVSTKVGGNAQSGNWIYNYRPAQAIIKPTFKVIHIIPSSNYAELEDANSETAKTVSLFTTSDSVNLGGLSAELMITYTYSDEANGYLTSLRLFTGQGDENGNEQLATATVALVAPENIGTKTTLAGALVPSYLMSDSDGAMPGANAILGANLGLTEPTCTNAFVSGSDSMNAYAEFYSDIASVLSPVDNQSYIACYSNNGGGDATAGAKMNAYLAYTYQYDPPPSEYTQNDWRWYDNADNIQPSLAKEEENTAITGINLADILRLRINLTIFERDLATSSQAFKLEWGEGSDCGAISGWRAVSGIGSGQTWEGYNNNSVNDGVDTGSILLASSTKFESYEETNPSLSNPRALDVSEQGEWDWVIYNNAATSSTDYCFRVVKDSDNPLEAYNSDSYPKLTTAPANTKPADPAQLGQYLDDEVTPIANQSWVTENNVKLKAAVTDPNINEVISLYFEIALQGASYKNSTTSPCLYGTPYTACGSKVWVATSTPGDYRTNPFIATTSITGIDDSATGYKWHVIACDDSTVCSDWSNFATGPNFKVDITPPDPPGSLSLAAITPTSAKLNFGASSTEDNFSEYKIFYKPGTSGVTEDDSEYNKIDDSALDEQDYSNQGSTTIASLSAGTEYVFNIWAYDLAGNTASATKELIATTTSSFTPPTGLIYQLNFASDGSGAVEVVIAVDDPDNDDTCRAKIFYRQGNCSFATINYATIDPTDENVTADYGDPEVDNYSEFQVGTTTGWIITSPLPPGDKNYVVFDWLSKSDIPGAYGTYCVGLVVNDGGQNQIATSTKSVFIDDLAPTTPGALSSDIKNYSSITLNLNPPYSSDLQFKRYRIFYSNGPTVTESDTEHTGYFGATSTSFHDLATTTVTGLSSGMTYYFNIWAYDNYGNRASSTVYATTTNSLPANLSTVNQYWSDELTAIPNGGWINEDEARLVSSANDSDTGELLSIYFQFLTNNGTFTTATSEPTNACAYGTAFGDCGSGIWQATSTAGDYSLNPFSATTSITAIPKSTIGYKWQILACDKDGDCANYWEPFNASIPNINVDNVDPSPPGPLSEYSKTARTVTFEFGGATDEDNFREYKIYYATSSFVTEADYLFGSSSDSNLSESDYDSAATTTVIGLIPETTYYFTIWAYDLAGNRASSTITSVTTEAIVSTPGVLFYTKNTRVLYYQVWTGAVWSTEQAGPTLGSGAGDNIRHVRAVRSDDGTRIGILAKTWDGVNQEWWGAIYRVAANDFTGISSLGSAQVGATNNQLITGCIAVLSGDEFMVVRNNNAANGTLVFSWNAIDEWVNEGAGPDPSAVVNGCELVRRPSTDNYLLLTFDDSTHAGNNDGDVGTAYYKGGATYTDDWTSWTEHSTSEEDTDNFVGSAFFDPSNNTRGGINYRNVNAGAYTVVKRFVCNDSSINYSASGVNSPATWSGDWVHGEYAADPGGTGVAYYTGDDANGEVNIYKVNVSTSTPTWYTPSNSDNISGGNLYAYTNDAQKPYAIIFYKDGYGVAGWNNAGAVAPNYRAINASTNAVDAADTAVPGATADTWSRVRFYNDPNENEFIAIYQNTDTDYASIFWDGEGDSFYNDGSDQAWQERVTGSGAADSDYECTSFAFSAGNASPNLPSGLLQYHSRDNTLIANGAWTTASSVKFQVAATDPDTSEALRIYLQLITNADTYSATTSVPANPCASTTPFGSCNSKIWAIATSTAGDYSINPFIATATLTYLPDTDAGYKWQVIVCDDSDACSSWKKFNVSNPNFKVDATPPTAPGKLTPISKTSTSVTLNFGVSTTEEYFSTYKIYYSTSTPVTETDSEHSDGDLGNQDYGGTANTLVFDLEPSTLYYFNIWAYDLAGNSASSTMAATTTNATYFLTQTSYLIENDDGGSVNSNTVAAAVDSPLANLYRGERFNVRIQIENTGGDTAGGKTYKLQYEADASGSWSDVGAATPISYSEGLSDIGDTTISSSSCAFNTNIWNDGEWYDGQAQTGSYSLPNGYYSEFVFAVETSHAVIGSTYRLRLFNSTDNSLLNGYISTSTITIETASTTRYSKNTEDSLPADTSDLTYFLDPEGYSDVASNDNTNQDYLIAANKIPVYLFATASSSNTDAISATWNGSSTASAEYKGVYLQVYRFGTTDDWVTIESNTAAATNTEFTLSGSLNSNLSDYYDANNWTYWRVYQENGNEILSTDYFNITFSPALPVTSQLHYQWRFDNGDEDEANWREDEDNGSPTDNAELTKGSSTRLRIEVVNTGGGDASGYKYQLEYASTTSDCLSDPGDWMKMPLTATHHHWEMATSSFFINGATTTPQLANSESYVFATGTMVEEPSSTSSAITLSEGYYSEIEYIFYATANATDAGIYCFRATNNGVALDDYDIYPILTLYGNPNTAPYFSAGGDPSDGSSASTTWPTNEGSNVVFSATAQDDDPGDDYYMAVCQTDSIKAGNNGPPECPGGEWCISDLASTTDTAICNYTAGTSTEVNDWYAFVCDKHAGFGFAKCSPSSQGNGDILNDSPFVINHRPIFTYATTTDNKNNPGETFTITAYAYDNDTAGGADTLRLRVCSSNGAGWGSCTAEQFCWQSSTSTPNAACSFATTTPATAGTWAYYAFIFDSHTLAATSSRSNTYTVNNTPPVLGTQTLNNDSVISPNIKGMGDLAVSTINSSIIDLNGCVDIDSIVGAIYISSLDNTCTNDPNNCYQIPFGPGNCAVECLTDTIASSTCTAYFKYFANPTDDTSVNNPWESDTWISFMRVFDGLVYSASTSAGVELTTTPAIDVTEPSIYFGSSMYPGDDTGDYNATSTVVNSGNTPIDTNLFGTNLVGGGDNIPAGKIEWNLNTFTYSLGNLKTEIEGGDIAEIIAPKATTTLFDINDEIYWGIEIPYGKEATTYYGENTFEVWLDDDDWPE